MFVCVCVYTYERTYVHMFMCTYVYMFMSTRVSYLTLRAKSVGSYLLHGLRLRPLELNQNQRGKR